VTNLIPPVFYFFGLVGPHSNCVLKRQVSFLFVHANVGTLVRRTGSKRLKDHFKRYGDFRVIRHDERMRTSTSLLTKIA